MFNSVDFSGDNKISLDEYLAAMGQVSPEKHKSVADYSQLIDTACVVCGRVLVICWLGCIQGHPWDLRKTD